MTAVLLVELRSLQWVESATRSTAINDEFDSAYYQILLNSFVGGDQLPTLFQQPHSPPSVSSLSKTSSLSSSIPKFNLSINKRLNASD